MLRPCAAPRVAAARPVQLCRRQQQLVPRRMAAQQSLRPRAASRDQQQQQRRSSSSQQEPEAAVVQTSQIVAYHPHPDAIRRRREHESRKQQREDEMRELAAVGLEWWCHRPPANMQTVSRREEYDSALLQCKAHYGLVVVDFFAPDCPGCRMLYPKLRQIAAANLDVAFIKVNTELDEMRHLSQELGVTGLPYFCLHAGHKVQAFAANLSKVGRLRTEIDVLKTAAAQQAAAAAGEALRSVV